MDFLGTNKNQYKYVPNSDTSTKITNVILFKQLTIDNKNKHITLLLRYYKTLHS